MENTQDLLTGVSAERGYRARLSRSKGVGERGRFKNQVDRGVSFNLFFCVITIKKPI